MKSYYKQYSIPQGETLPESASPSDKRVNLIKGLPVYGISTDAPFGATYETDYYNSREDVASLLTDGVYSSVPNYEEKSYFHFTRGSSRSIVFRLPSLCAVDGFAMGILRQDETGVRLPRRVDVYISENGSDWQRVVKLRSLCSADSPECFRINKSFDKVYRACWLQVELDVPCHVFVDEIELFGTTAVSENAVSPVGESMTTENAVRRVDRYPAYEDFLDVHNLLLAYNCLPPENMVNADGTPNERGLITEEEFIPHLAYINKDGVMEDTFFDSFLFLPYSRYTYSKLYKCASGWNYYIDNVFADGRNLDALDSAAGKVEKQLGLKDYKVKAFFSILHTRVHYGEFPDKFGDLDGDGADEDFTALTDRKKATKWCIDRTLELYAAKEHPHVTLGGFYWFEEEINYNDAFELELIAFAREYLHAKGYKLFWIPYFQAWGYQDWKENGFDIACMQPNYAFRKQEPKDRLYDNAVMTKQLGMCTELEIGGIKDPVDIERYKDYLDVGAETGYMKTIKMYYQGGVPGEFYNSFKSSDPFVRSVYDDTYLFAKEKYVPRKK